MSHSSRSKRPLVITWVAPLKPDIYASFPGRLLLYPIHKYCEFYHIDLMLMKNANLVILSLNTISRQKLTLFLLELTPPLTNSIRYSVIERDFDIKVSTKFDPMF